MKPRRGEVWLVNFDPAVGAEQRKFRPAVVMSVESVGRLPLRIVVPVTEWQERYAAFPWFVRLPATRASGLTKESGADAFQVKSLDKERFNRRLGILTEAELDAIAAAIALCVGF